MHRKGARRRLSTPLAAMEIFFPCDAAKDNRNLSLLSRKDVRLSQDQTTTSLETVRKSGKDKHVRYDINYSAPLHVKIRPNRVAEPESLNLDKYLHLHLHAQ